MFKDRCNVAKSKENDGRHVVCWRKETVRTSTTAKGCGAHHENNTLNFPGKEVADVLFPQDELRIICLSIEPPLEG